MAFFLPSIEQLFTKDNSSRKSYKFYLEETKKQEEEKNK